MTREFAAGDTFELAGIWFRVVEGRKGPEDLRMDWLTESGWVAIPFVVLYLLTHFLTENEDVLYPPPAAGGDKLMTELWWARRRGWRHAEARLEAEKAAKV